MTLEKEKALDAMVEQAIDLMDDANSKIAKLALDYHKNDCKDQSDKCKKAYILVFTMYLYEKLEDDKKSLADAFIRIIKENR